MSTHGRKPLALIIARAVVTGSFIASAPGVLAQSERIVVTGSSILRTQTEGALPVLTLDRQYIEQSGATNSDRSDPADSPRCRTSWLRPPA